MSPNKKIILDALFVSGLVALSCFPWILGLGFYSDDYAQLRKLIEADTSPDYSIVKKYFYQADRPTSSAYRALLYDLAGSKVLVYHVANNITFCFAVLGVYTSVLCVTSSRFAGLSTCLIFGSLPTYSANRFWWSSSAPNLALLLVLGAFVAAWAAVQSEQALRRYPLYFLATASSVISATTYETNLPLAILLPVTVWTLLGSGRWSKSTPSFLCWSLVQIGIILALGFWKRSIAPRLTSFDVAAHSTQLIRESAYLHFVTYGIDFPLVVSRLLTYHFDLTRLLLCVIWGIAAGLYLTSVRHTAMRLGPLRLLQMCIVGLFVFIGGYAIFLTNQNVGFTPTGILNRTAESAAVGSALIVASILAMAGGLTPSRFRWHVTSAALAVWCAGGVYITGTVAKFWEDASLFQQKIEQGLKRHGKQLPIPAESIVLLWGSCRYTGPGIIFETKWDFGNALKLWYPDQRLKGDVINGGTYFSQDSVFIPIYGERARYPLNKIVMHDARNGSFAMPASEIESRQLLRDAIEWSRMNCSMDREGSGVPIMY